MTDEHIVTAGSLTAYLQSVRMEIDDDDEDIVEVSIELTNESAIPVGGLTATINTSTGSTIEPTSGVTSIGPGLTRSFSFAFKLSDGNWSFSLNGQGQTLSLGPYEVDLSSNKIRQEGLEMRLVRVFSWALLTTILTTSEMSKKENLSIQVKFR